GWPGRVAGRGAGARRPLGRAVPAGGDQRQARPVAVPGRRGGRRPGLAGVLGRRVRRGDGAPARPAVAGAGRRAGGRPRAAGLGVLRAGAVVLPVAPDRLPALGRFAPPDLAAAVAGGDAAAGLAGWSLPVLGAEPAAAGATAPGPAPAAGGGLACLLPTELA